MLPNFNLKPTPQLIFGTGRHKELPSLLECFGSKLLIVVGGQSFTSGQYWPALQHQLDKHGYTCNLVRIAGEPSPTDIDAITEKYATQTIDAVIAIGGGSVLDAGKAISAMLVEQEPVTPFLEGVGTKQPSGKKLPFIALPTTSGTGSEATSNAVISSVGQNGFKKSLRHDNYIPDIALLDPQLTTGCPHSLTVACGMDTLTQLVEAYLSTNGSPLTDILALEGIQRVINSLPKACDDGTDISARADLSYSSYLSGIVLANAGLGLVHGFASAIGGLNAIPHGVVCGTLMAEANRLTLQHLRKNAGDNIALKKYAHLGRLTTDSNLTDSEAQDRFVEYLTDLCTTLGIPRLGDYGITDQLFDDILQQTGNKYNPAPLTKEEQRLILQLRL